MRALLLIRLKSDNKTDGANYTVIFCVNMGSGCLRLSGKLLKGMTGSCGQIKTKSVSFPVSSGAFSSAKRRNKKLKQIHVK